MNSDDGLPTDAEIEAAMKPGLSVNLATMLAIAAAAVPFVLTLRFDDFDPVRVAGGAIAVSAGLLGIVVAVRGRATTPPARSLGLSVIAIAIGAFHLARAGLVGGSGTLSATEARTAAAAYLAEQGFTDTELLAIDGTPSAFSFEGYKDDGFCSGRVEVRRSGSGLARDWAARCGVDEPRERAERSCDAGRSTSCAAAARAAREAEPPDLVAAERRATRGCDASDRSACFELGLALTGPDVRDEARLARGVAAYRTSCDGGAAAACNNLGVLLGAGRGAPRDETGSCDAYERACTDTYFRGCAAFADCFAHGRGRAADPARAYSLYETACSHGRVEGCSPAAAARMRGEGTTADAERGVRELRELCEAEAPSREACLTLGFAFHTGLEGVAKDRVAARALFERGCQLESGASCRDAAIYRRDGLGGQPRDREGAAALFDRGCTLGDASACELAGQLR